MRQGCSQTFVTGYFSNRNYDLLFVLVNDTNFVCLIIYKINRVKFPFMHSQEACFNQSRCSQIKNILLIYLIACLKKIHLSHNNDIAPLSAKFGLLNKLVVVTLFARRLM